MVVVKRIALALCALAVLVFALIGVLHTFRGTPVSGVAQVGGGERGVGDPVFRAATEALIETPLQGGNDVEILDNGDETFPLLWRDLAGARRSIDIRLYYMEPGGLAQKLKRVLVERARAGVPVRVLYDAVGSSLPDAYVDSPRAAGVRALPYRPVHWYSLDRAQDRSHVRAVVVDGRIGYTGGFGIADKWAGDGRHAGQWRDVNVRFSGPAVVRLQAAFLAGWAEASHELLTGSRFFPPDAPTPAGDHVAGLLYTSPGSGSTQAERFFALSITGAQRTLYITNAYFIPDAGMRRLLEAAVRRGVDVRVLTAGEKIDVKSVRYASHAHDEELLRAGVRIYEYQPSMIHSKSFVVDGVWATVGSMNFDNRATALNEESSLVVYDRRLGARLDSTFLADLRFAHEIRLSDFAQRPFYQRLLERGAVLLERLM